jgi:hypothetical protein
MYPTMILKDYPKDLPKPREEDLVSKNVVYHLK